MRTLAQDPIFNSIKDDFMDLMDNFQENEACIKQLKELYEKLSSGHSILLLTMTHLVTIVEDKTLVLIDEPESHLHPPLLSAFIRALSDLLQNRNAVSIVATHSPVVLQEVPKSSTWILNRVGNIIEAHRPAEETFGENIGSLTNEVFVLKTYNSGYVNILQKIVSDHLWFDYDAILSKVLHGELGIEGKSILCSLIQDRDNNEENQ